MRFYDIFPENDFADIEKTARSLVSCFLRHVAGIPPTNEFYESKAEVSIVGETLEADILRARGPPSIFSMMRKLTLTGSKVDVTFVEAQPNLSDDKGTILVLCLGTIYTRLSEDDCKFRVGRQPDDETQNISYVMTCSGKSAGPTIQPMMSNCVIMFRNKCIPINTTVKEPRVFFSDHVNAMSTNRYRSPYYHDFLFGTVRNIPADDIEPNVVVRPIKSNEQNQIRIPQPCDEKQSTPGSRVILSANSVENSHQLSYTQQYAVPPVELDFTGMESMPIAHHSMQASTLPQYVVESYQGSNLQNHVDLSQNVTSHANVESRNSTSNDKYTDVRSNVTKYDGDVQNKDEQIQSTTSRQPTEIDHYRPAPRNRPYQRNNAYRSGARRNGRGMWLSNNRHRGDYYGNNGRRTPPVFNYVPATDVVNRSNSNLRRPYPDMPRMHPEQNYDSH